MLDPTTEEKKRKEKQPRDKIKAGYISSLAGMRAGGGVEGGNGGKWKSAPQFRGCCAEREAKERLLMAAR